MKIKIPFLALVLSIGAVANAQILIGQTAAFTGGPAPYIKEMTLAAKLVIDDINARGGIRGEKIELISMDDGFDVKRAVANTEILITQKKVTALLLNRGTPHTEAMVPLLVKYKIPLIGPSTGAMSLHSPVIPGVFNVRSTYQYEAERVIAQFDAMGLLSNFGIIYNDDSFGADVLLGANRALKSKNMTPLFSIGYDPKVKDPTEATKDAISAALKHKSADGSIVTGLLIIGAIGPAVAVIKGIREGGGYPYIATLSITAASGFIDALGPDSRYVMVSQVFPGENKVNIPLVRDTLALLKSHNKELKLTPAMMEGAASTRLLIDALKKTPSPITSKSLIATLESGTKLDIGWEGYEITYSPTNHSGMKFAEPSIINAKRDFRR